MLMKPMENIIEHDHRGDPGTPGVVRINEKSNRPEAAPLTWHIAKGTLRFPRPPHSRATPDHNMARLERNCKVTQAHALHTSFTNYKPRHSSPSISQISIRIADGLPIVNDTKCLAICAELAFSDTGCRENLDRRVPADSGRRK